MKQNTSFKPFGARDSKVLILGSFPGEESLRRREYYAHPYNTFWRIIADTFGVVVPETFTGRCRLLKDHKIALWDVVHTCRRQTSSDAKITCSLPNDIVGFLEKHPCINTVIINGRKAEQLFVRYFGEKVTVSHVYLPSTSPAHASLPYGKKQKLWSASILKGLRKKQGRSPA